MGCCSSSVAILEAARDGDVKLLGDELSRGADLNMVNDNGSTATMIAAYYDHAECLRLLLDKGEEVNTLNKNGNTATMSA